MAKARIKRAKRKNGAFPTPALLSGLRGGADWHMKEAPDGVQGSTINLHGQQAEMMIPTGDDATARYTRLHELLHAAHSPLEEPRDVQKADGTVISKQGLLMAEEIRIDSIGRAMAGKNSLPDTLRDRMQEFVNTVAPLYAETGKPELANEIIDMALASWAQDQEHMGSQHFMAKMLRSLAYSTSGEETQRLGGLIDLIDEAFNRMFHQVWEDEFEALFEDQEFPSWKSVMELGQFIDTIRKATKKLGKKVSAPSVDPDITKLADLSVRNTGGHTEMVNLLDEGLEKQGLKPPVTSNDGELRWGQMTIIRPPRPLRLPKTKSSRSKYSATDAGASPRYIHRLLTDGQVFARKKRVPGGSVLIDDSGSMSWTNQEVQHIVESAPAVDIGAYSGSGGTGELVIISEDGTWADAELNRPNGGGNVVDMPALEWLATKKEPRIWVSDQLVVPVNGSMEEAAAEVLAFVQANDINVVETAEEAAEVFSGKKAIYR